MEHDIEKTPQVGGKPSSDTNNDGAVHGESFAYGNSTYARLQRLAGKFHIEQRGIERVPEDERTDTSYLNIGSMVCSWSSSRRRCVSVLTRAVARGQHGGQLVRDRCPRKDALSSRIRRCDPRVLVLQPARCHDRMLLLLLWARVRLAPDGAE